MSARTAPANLQLFVSTLLERISVNVLQEQFRMPLVGAYHLTNVFLIMTAQKQQLAIMENVKTPVRSPGLVERMQFAPPLIIAPCVLVHPEQTATPRSAACLLNVSATLTAPARGRVSATNAWTSAACPMCVDRTPTAELPTILPAASVCQDSPESRPLGVPS